MVSPFVTLLLTSFWNLETPYCFVKTLWTQTVTIHPYSFLRTYLFFSRNYSSFPRHWPADSTCLHNRFLLSASLDFLDSFLITHCTSSWFHRIPPCSFCFVIALDFPESQVYINPQLATYFPKLDLLCTLVHCHTNLVIFPFSCPWLFASLCRCSEPVTCPQNLSPTPRKSLGHIFEPSTLT